MDESIITYIKKKYNIIIGERTAEQAKIQIGCAYICDELPEETMAIRGLDTVSGLPREIVISSYEVREAIEEQTTAIVDAVKSTLEQSPPELSADIIENGIYLSGGGALLKGLDSLMSLRQISRRLLPRMHWTVLQMVLDILLRRAISTEIFDFMGSWTIN